MFMIFSSMSQFSQHYCNFSPKHYRYNFDKINNKQIIMYKSSQTQKPKNVILYQIPTIQQFKRINYPIVSDQNKKLIKEKLTIEKQSIQKTKQREKEGNFFINYDRNPFTEVKTTHKAQKKTKKLDSKGLFLREVEDEKKEDKNIVDELHKKIMFFQSQRKEQYLEKILQFQQDKNKMARLAQKIKGGVGKISFTPIQLSDETDNSGLLNQTDKNIQDDIESIANMKDQNFYLKKNNQMNIFRYGLGQQFEVGKTLLDNHFFSFNSVIQKIQKVKIPIYRDLSRMGRRVILGLSTHKQKIIDFIDSQQLSFKLGQLQFQDVMSIVSGRLSSQFIYKTINFDGDFGNTKEVSDSSSEQAEVNIYYKPYLLNRQDHYSNGNEEAQQIIDYLKLQNNQKQKEYAINCDYRKKVIDQYIQMMQELYRLTIKDKTLHSNLSTEVKKQLQSYLNMDRSDITDIDRIVRTNKMKKQKNEAIKYEKLHEIILTINQHNEKMKNIKSKEAKSQVYKPTQQKPTIQKVKK